MKNYNWMKLILTLVTSGLAGVAGHAVLPSGWDAIISAVVVGLGALHVEPPHKD